jgi:energy-coupling factor transporter ATP-binding protein EcfA2
MDAEEYIHEAVYALLAAGGIRCKKGKNYIGEAKEEYCEKLKKNCRNSDEAEKIYKAGIEILKRPVRALSGGQRRRIELDARILAADILSKESESDNKGVLLILDEPTTGFDWQNQDVFLKRVYEVVHGSQNTSGHENMAIVVVTHALNRLTKARFDELVYVKKEELEIRGERVECCKVSQAEDVGELYKKLKSKLEDGGSEENVGYVWQGIFKMKVEEVHNLMEGGNK